MREKTKEVAVQPASVRRMVIAPTVQVARLFITRFEHMQGCKLDDREVWFLQRAWPCCTHEDVARMEEMMAYARFRGADVRRWRI